MALFICQNPSCDDRGKIKTFDKVTYIIKPEGLRSPQRECRICGTYMDDVTEFDGFPVDGVPKGSSNF